MPISYWSHYIPIDPQKVKGACVCCTSHTDHIIKPRWRRQQREQPSTSALHSVGTRATNMGADRKEANLFYQFQKFTTLAFLLCERGEDGANFWPFFCPCRSASLRTEKKPYATDDDTSVSLVRGCWRRFVKGTLLSLSQCHCCRRSLVKCKCVCMCAWSVSKPNGRKIWFVITTTGEGNDGSVWFG